MDGWIRENIFNIPLWRQIQGKKFDAISNPYIRTVFQTVENDFHPMYYSREGLFVAKSQVDSAGLGLYALREFKPNEIITIFSGYRYEEDKWDAKWSQLPDTYRLKSDYIVSYKDDDTKKTYIVDPTDDYGKVFLPFYTENVAPYINQPPFGTQANCESVLYTKRSQEFAYKLLFNEESIVACRDIKVGDELYWLYGTTGTSIVPLRRIQYKTGIDCQGKEAPVPLA